jgi:hypothetical protein
MTAPRRQRKLSPLDPSFLGRGLLAAAVATGGPLVSAATTLVAVVARGVAVPGDPGLWLIVNQRLYLFYTLEARDTSRATSSVS